MSDSEARLQPPRWRIEIDGAELPENIGILIGRDERPIHTSDLSLTPRTAMVPDPYRAWLTKRNRKGEYVEAEALGPRHLIVAINNDGCRVEFDTSTGEGKYTWRIEPPEASRCFVNRPCGE